MALHTKKKTRRTKNTQNKKTRGAKKKNILTKLVDRYDSQSVRTFSLGATGRENFRQVFESANAAKGLQMFNLAMPTHSTFHRSGSTFFLGFWA